MVRVASVLTVRLVAGVAVALVIVAGAGVPHAAPWLFGAVLADVAGLAAWLWWRGRRVPRPAPVAPASTESVALRAVCHEFRGPVASLSSLTRALADERRAGPPLVRAEIARLAHDQAVQLDGLLRQAVTVTGAMQTPGADDGGPVPLRRVLHGAAAALPAHRLRLALGPGVAEQPVPRQFQQVLTNLLDNALRHGPDPGTVRLTARYEPRGLVLAVADEGALTDGLTEALSRTTPPAGVAGLGLWIVRRLVAAQGGTVTARPTGRRGVTVEVVLPAPWRGAGAGWHQRAVAWP